MIHIQKQITNRFAFFIFLACMVQLVQLFVVGYIMKSSVI